MGAKFKQVREEIFDYNGQLAHRIQWHKREGMLKFGLAVLLAVNGVTEVSKGLSPILQTPSLSDYPLLSTLSRLTEDPLAIGALSLTAATAFGWSAWKYRARHRAVDAEQRRVRISPPNPPPPNP